MKKLVVLCLLLVFVGSVSAADITTGLVGWWKMDGQQDSGNSRLVKDYSGFDNHGTMGGSDVWLAGGEGIDFDGGSWGASGIVFANNGADLIADMGLTSAVTISYVATWDAYVAGANYPYEGKSATRGRILASEQPTGNHIRDHKGGDDMWCWEAFNDTHANFIFQKNGLGKTWGDFVTITTVVDFDTTEYKIYVDGIQYASSAADVVGGTFADLDSFTIGRTLWAEMDGSMKDFRIYDRALTAEDVAALVPEPATLALLGLGAIALVKRKRS